MFYFIVELNKSRKKGVSSCDWQMISCTCACETEPPGIDQCDDVLVSQACWKSQENELIRFLKYCPRLHLFVTCVFTGRLSRSKSRCLFGFLETAGIFSNFQEFFPPKFNDGMHHTGCFRLSVSFPLALCVSLWPRLLSVGGKSCLHSHPCPCSIDVHRSRAHWLKRPCPLF